MVVNRLSNVPMNMKAGTESSDERYTAAIRRHVFDRVPLSRALKDAGFTPSYSRRSKNDLMKVSRPFAEAWRFVEAEQRARRFEGHSKDFSPANLAGESDGLKGMVKRKLTENVQKGVDGGVRSAQLLGNFKENDWFVKPGGEMQYGFLAVFNDPEARANIERMSKAVDDYQECSWCGEDVGSSQDLQKHSLVCPKRPIAIQAQPTLLKDEKRALFQ